MRTFPAQQSRFARCLSQFFTKIPTKCRQVRLHTELTRKCSGGDLMDTLAVPLVRYSKHPLRGLLSTPLAPAVCLVVLGTLAVSAHAQMIDNTQASNPINAGINKSLAQEIGAGRGSVNTPDSSLFIINRDAFRAVRRGRQLFQRKFTRVQGQGPGVDDGVGNIATTKEIGAGLADSCAACHGRPRGSAGVGGDVVTRPDSRDAPHLFGLGLKEMLADEITADLRAIRDRAVAGARSSGASVRLPLISKGIFYGFLTAAPSGTVDTSAVQGVDPDLRVRPLFLHGATISIRQ